MRRLLFPLLVLAVAASACSALGEAPAATVDGHEISLDVISDEIDIIEANDAYRNALEESYGKQITEGGTFDAAFAAQLLTIDVYYEVIERDLERRGVEISAEALATAEAEIANQFGSRPEILEAFPESYQQQLHDRRAMIETVNLEIAAGIGDDERTFYDDNPEEFTEICVSHALVGLQGGRTPAEAKKAAQDLYDRVEGGEDFEDIATNESDDTTAAADQGALGCGSRLTLQFDPVFLEAAFALETDVVSEPVQTQFGSHLILVTSRKVPNYRDVADQVESVMINAHTTRVNEYFKRLICSADVDVNARYGSWTHEACESIAAPPPAVAPPEGPMAEPDEGLQFEG